MAVDIQLPHLGENIETGKVVRILVGVGDQVDADENVLEVETDKASIDVPVEVAGTIEKIYAKVGQNIGVGEAILSILPGGGSGNASTPIEDADQVSELAQDIAVPTKPDAAESAPSDSESNVPDTPPADAEMAPLKLSEQISVPTATSALGSATAARRGANDVRKLVPAAPSTRRFAREIGIDIAAVAGSGPGGRISIEDVKVHAKDRNLQSGSGNRTGVVQRALPDFSRWGDVEIEDMSGIRKKTADHMAATWATVPQVTQFDKADVTELERQRKSHVGRLGSGEVKVTVTAILIKVVATALRKFPQFNSSVDVVNEQIIRKRYCNIGVAVDTERGLLVPVIRDADKKNIGQISNDLVTLAERARDRKISPDEMQGGTFTVSNLGGIGGTAFTPIVNWPETAILGVARGRIEAVHDGNGFAPRHLLPLSLSYDHRVIDGADGARFLRWIVTALENPWLLLMDEK